MAFNGSGTFNRLYSWATDKLNGIKIRADRMDAEMDGFATGLSTCITKDGQTTVTADIPFNSNKLTGVAEGTDRTHAATVAQLQDNESIYFTATGTDTYAITPAPALGAYAAGVGFYVNFTNANTGAATLNVSGLGAKAITKNGTTALQAGDISAGGVYRVVYDGTRFQLINAANLTAETEWLAARGKLTATITTGTTAGTANRRYKITGGTLTLPTFTADQWLIVEMDPAAGTTVTIGRNSQTIDGASEDDTYIGDGGTGPVVAYHCTSAGVVTSQIIGGVP